MPFGNEGYQIACAMPIYDSRNMYCGVMALELDLEMLAAHVASLGNSGAAVRNKYIVDRFGFVCLKLGQDADGIPFRRQRLPEHVSEQIVRRSCGSWVEKVGNKEYLWTFSSLDSPRWFYVERIDLAEILKAYSSGF